MTTQTSSPGVNAARRVHGQLPAKDTQDPGQDGEAYLRLGCYQHALRHVQMRTRELEAELVARQWLRAHRERTAA